MSSAESTHRGAAPPSVDLTGHFREIVRALLPALLIAVVVTAAMFALRSAGAKEYAASIVTQITPAQMPVPGDPYVEQMRAPFIALSQDTNVLDQVLSQVDTGWDASALKDHVQTSPGPSPQLLIFTVNAGSTELAQQIAQTMVAAVSQASFANQTRDLGRQLDRVQASLSVEQSTNGALAPDDPAKTESDARLEDLRAQLASIQAGEGDKLTVLARPEPDPAPISPKPLSESLVAGLAALVIAAELIVLWRGRVGSRPNRTWARRMAHRHRAEFDARTKQREEIPLLLAAKVGELQREGRKVLVLLGAGAVFPRSGAGPESPDTMITEPLAAQWWHDIDAREVALAIVVVRMKSRDRVPTDKALRQLAGLDVPRWLVLQPAQKTRKHRGKTAARAAETGSKDRDPDVS